MRTRMSQARSVAEESCPQRATCRPALLATKAVSTGDQPRALSVAMAVAECRKCAAVVAPVDVQNHPRAQRVVLSVSPAAAEPETDRHCGRAAAVELLGLLGRLRTSQVLKYTHVYIRSDHVMHELRPRMPAPNNGTTHHMGVRASCAGASSVRSALPGRLIGATAAMRTGSGPCQIGTGTRAGRATGDASRNAGLPAASVTAGACPCMYGPWVRARICREEGARGGLLCPGPWGAPLGLAGWSRLRALASLAPRAGNFDPAPRCSVVRCRVRTLPDHICYCTHDGG